jgi:hypothetical protein
MGTGRHDIVEFCANESLGSISLYTVLMRGAEYKRSKKLMTAGTVGVSYKGPPFLKGSLYMRFQDYLAVRRSGPSFQLQPIHANGKYAGITDS